jgi:hypothetical protein
MHVLETRFLKTCLIFWKKNQAIHYYWYGFALYYGCFETKSWEMMEFFGIVYNLNAELDLYTKALVVYNVPFSSTLFNLIKFCAIY